MIISLTLTFSYIPLSHVSQKGRDFRDTIDPLLTGPGLTDARLRLNVNSYRINRPKL
jgi:hypothetical protein